MPAVCLYFQLHQPYRVKKYRVFDVGVDHEYFNQDGDTGLNNLAILARVVRKCYLPATKLLLKLVNENDGFKVSFSITGVLLKQLEEHFPEVISLFKELAKTGRVEFLGETYYHSLAILYSEDEFTRQVLLHQRKIKKLFGQTTRIFRNTELIYNNKLAVLVQQLGFKGIICEGADKILGWRSPNFVYHSHGEVELPVLLKDYRMSDDIAFRFSSREWNEYPLTADKYAQWIAGINGQVVGLFMDYETLGEHQWAETGIFEFLEHLPREVLKHSGCTFVTPSEAIKNFAPVGEIDVPEYVSWADTERDLSAWRSNEMQEEALSMVYMLEKPVMASRNKKLVEDWRRLLVSDHFYYMCTKWFADGDVHKYFNPYESPYEAFIAFANVVNDLRLRL